MKGGKHMKKEFKILLGVLGGVTVLAGIFWSAVAICAHYGLNHMFDEENT